MTRSEFVGFILICLLACASCAHDIADRYYVSALPPRDPSSVEVLYVRPSRKFVVVADFQARQADEDFMRDKAAEAGADAVIVSRVGGLRAPGESRADQDSMSGYRGGVGHIVGTAIKYKENN